MLLKRQFAFSALLMLLVLAVGTAGYSLIEGWRLFDAFFMTVITVTTVGYGEVHKLDRAGEVFTVILLFFSLGIIFYILNTGAKAVIEGEFRNILGRRKLEKKMQNLRGHYIICGYGRMGRIISREFLANKVHYAVIEKALLPEGVPAGLLVVQGDATKDEVLKEAGIERAAGLVSVLPTDAENLYVVLTAKGLNPALTVVARAGEEGSEQKLLRAGADRVISPYHIGGLRIAHTILKPAVVDFIEFATSAGNIELQMEEINVKEGSELAGKTLHESGVGRDLGVIIVAMKSGGEMRFNPTSRSMIKAGDVLIALGDIPKLRTLEKMAGKA
ncbi:MAG: potassium channel protein [Nitrospiraceae bacterium]|nr:potassium channel protein [Nitrospiraceae bacterium]